MSAQEKNDKIAADKIARARSILVLDHPFFGHPVMQVQAQSARTLPNGAHNPTGYTDGRGIWYNPDWIAPMPIQRVVFFLAHEGLHIMFGHHARRGNRELQRWNIACDRIVNPTLITGRVGEMIPGGAVGLPGDAERHTEAIYAELPKCKTIQLDAGGCGAVIDITGPSGEAPTPAQIAEACQQANVTLAQAVQLAKSAGKLPQGLERLVHRQLTPQVNWRDALQRFVNTSARADFSWSKLNRRYLQAGLGLPSLRSEALPPIAIFIDTSGSIDQRMLDRFAGEMTAILYAYHVSAIVIYVDASVAKVQEISTDELPLVLTPAGGGGTDFRPPFAYLAQHGIEPACAIYFTDLCCDSYPAEPEYPVLWVVCNKWKQKLEVPFGDCVEIADDGC